MEQGCHSQVHIPIELGLQETTGRDCNHPGRKLMDTKEKWTKICTRHRSCVDPVTSLPAQNSTSRESWASKTALAGERRCSSFWSFQAEPTPSQNLPTLRRKRHLGALGTGKSRSPSSFPQWPAAASHPDPKLAHILCLHNLILTVTASVTELSLTYPHVCPRTRRS